MIYPSYHLGGKPFPEGSTSTPTPASGPSSSLSPGGPVPKAGARGGAIEDSWDGTGGSLSCIPVRPTAAPLAVDDARIIVDHTDRTDVTATDVRNAIEVLRAVGYQVIDPEGHVSVAGAIAALREVIEDLWDNIADEDVKQLQPSTVQLARLNHDRLNHETTD